MLSELTGKLRYLAGIPAFLRETISPDEAREQVARDMAGQDQSFLCLAKAAIYTNPRSPYRRLLLSAGIEFDDLERMVHQLGLESAAARLFEAGVYLTYEEFKGRRPVERNGVEFFVDQSGLKNPLLRSSVELRSSGASGPRSLSVTSLEHVAHEAAYYALLLDAHAATHRPVAVWGPPSVWGLNSLLRYSKVAKTPSQFFTTTRLTSSGERLRAGLMLGYAFLAARLSGKRLPWPRFVPVDRGLTVARWLAEMTRRGTPALLDIPVSAAARVAIAAAEEGLDISGTVFRNGSEPLTPAKAAVIEAAGARVINVYASTEIGLCGLGCAAPVELDDLHLLTDKLVVRNQEKVIGNSSAVPALVYTTALTSARRVMLNVESGDYGRIEKRDCGCLLRSAGLATHVLGLRGYDKLTSAGVSFKGDDLYTLVEQLLPARFGGYPTDYQLVEQRGDSGGWSISILIAPSVGAVDEAAVRATVLEILSRNVRDGDPSMAADRPGQGQTLPVLRRAPYILSGRKTLPLHVLPGRSKAGVRSR